MTAEYDITIVGGGLVGASLLLALQQTDLKIAIIEPKEVSTRVEPELDKRSLVLSLASKLFYEELGIWPQISKLCTPIEKIKVSEQGRFSKVFLDKRSFGVPALGYVINIQLLNKVIWDNIKLNNNIDIYCPYKLNNLSSLDSSNRSASVEEYTSLDISRVQAKGIDNSEDNQSDNYNLTLNSNIVIAADGGRSYVRALLDIPYESHDYQQIAVIVNVEHDENNNNIAYERFSKQGPFAILPGINPNISGIVWPWPKDKQDYIKGLSDQEFIIKLQDLFGYKLGKFTKIGQRQVFPLWRIVSQKLYKDRVLLLGNAANHIHPIGGQGFNLGLRDVDCFINVLNQKYLNDISNLSDSTSIGSINNLFTEYSSLRKDDHYNLVNGTHNLLELFASDNILVKNIRSFGLSAMNHSLLLRTMISDRSMGLNINI